MDIDPSALTEMVNYVEATQPIIEKTASLEAAIAERAPQTADALIEAGIFPATKRAEAIASLQNPLSALESLEKVAASYKQQNEQAPAASLGKAAELRNAGVPEGTAKRSKADEAFLSRLGF